MKIDGEEWSKDDEESEEPCGCCTFMVGAYWWTAFCEEHSYYGQRDLITPMRD